MTPHLEGENSSDTGGSSDEEIPTFEEAKRMRKSVVERLKSDGSVKASAQAVLISECRNGKRCLQPECPVCARRKALGGDLIRYFGTQVLSVSTKDIRIRGQRRGLDPAKVDFIAASLSEIGQTMPILVEWDGRNRKRKFRLIDGAYRLAGAKHLGWEEIQIIAVPGYMNEDVELVQCTANFYRVDLCALEKAEHLDRMRELVRKRPEEGQDAPPGGRQPHDAGIKKTARRLGVTKEEVRRASRISAISMEAKAEIWKLKLDDNQKALLEIAKQPTPEDQVLVALAIAERRDVVDRDQATTEELAAEEIENLKDGISRQKKTIEKASVALEIRQQRVVQLQSQPELAVDLNAVVAPETPTTPQPESGDCHETKAENLEAADLSEDSFQQAVTAWRATPGVLYLNTLDRCAARRFIAAVFAELLEPLEYDGLVSSPEEAPS